MLKRILKWGGGALLLGAIGIQLVPVDRSNPPVEADLDAPADVKAILRRACYDCHSNETTWPWYAYVAPISWRVTDHVHHGRRELNFSKWGTYNSRRQAHKRREAWSEIRKGDMPLSDYLSMHSEAVLTDADKAVLKAWLLAGQQAGGDDDDDEDEAHEHTRGRTREHDDDEEHEGREEDEDDD